MKKLVVLAGFLVLLSAVKAQQVRNVTFSDVATVQETSESNSEASSDPTNLPITENAQLAENLRQEIERRRQERQQRIEERRETILKNLENLSDRKREFELRRQERLRNTQEMIEDRRQEMEARRAGRIPAREQERVLRLRQERLENTVPNDEQNEVDSPKQLLPALSDLVRRIVLIQEPSGNVKLVDVDTEEGRDLIWRVTERVENEEEQAEALRKLKVKLGQI
ncbi:AAEL011042-PA [Aedes aegypti]|uniref:AAEL011042-PA n=1 Tax=Aedes aegypti TaxID=7159 RepID=Q16R83_AEDAE|nr:AAEL011042-PA [Aedes aegypti]